MKIWLSDAGKRFNRDWIFRHLSYTFIAGHSYAIVGPNGSGKSTLLQLISGALAPSEGKAEWGDPSGVESKTTLDPDGVFRYVSICAPYLDVVEEMTALEFLKFHGKFKKMMLPAAQVIEAVGLKSAAHKQIRYYSSGMKQRVKLAQAFFSDTPVLLLDEPCTNLDEAGYELYYSLLRSYCNNRLIIVCSNEERELALCETRLSILDYK